MSIISYFFFSILNDSIKMLIVKYVYFYSCNSIVLKKKQSSFILYEHYGLCLVYWSHNFWIFGIFFLNFRNNDIICNNCKMHLLLQFSFNRFKIIQGFSMGYQHYHLCLVWRSMSVKIFGIFLKILKFWYYKQQLRRRLRLLRFSFNRFEIIQGSTASTWFQNQFKHR